MPINYAKRLLVFLFAVVLFTACNDKEIVKTSDENELNQMLVALKEAGIDADRISSGEAGKEIYKITVDDGFFSTGAEAEARRILRENCLPYTPPPPVKEGSMGLPSAAIELEKKKVQAQTNIEKLLLLHNGVICAKVNIVYPEKAMESLKPYDSSATVLIKYKTPTLSVSEQKLKEEVAGSIEKLKPENVTVTMEPSPITPADLKTASSMNKMLVTGGAVAGIIGLTMLILLMRRKKVSDDEFDDTEFLEEGEVNLLESAEEE